MASTETHLSTWWATAIGTLADGCWRHSSGTLRLQALPAGASDAGTVVVVVVVAVTEADPVGLVGSTSPSR